MIRCFWSRCQNEEDWLYSGERTTSLADLQLAAAELSEQERAALALWLLETLPPHSEVEDVLRDEIAEATRRSEELDSGKMKGLSADEFWSSIKQARSSWK